MRGQKVVRRGFRIPSDEVRNWLRAGPKRQGSNKAVPYLGPEKLMARKYEHSLKELLHQLQVVKGLGMLKPGQAESLSSSVKKLRHAVRVRDPSRTEVAVEEFARQLLKQDFLKRLIEDLD